MNVRKVLLHVALLLSTLTILTIATCISIAIRYNDYVIASICLAAIVIPFIGWLYFVDETSYSKKDKP